MNFELENILTIAEIPQTDDALELSGKLKKKTLHIWSCLKPYGVRISGGGV